MLSEMSVAKRWILRCLHQCRASSRPSKFLVKAAAVRNGLVVCSGWLRSLQQPSTAVSSFSSWALADPLADRKYEIWSAAAIKSFKGDGGGEARMNQNYTRTARIDWRSTTAICLRRYWWWDTAPYEFVQCNECLIMIVGRCCGLEGKKLEIFTMSRLGNSRLGWLVVL